MANRTPRSEWAALFNFAGGGLVHLELFPLILMSSLNPTLFEAISAYLMAYGTHANRPAAGNVPLNALYWETDTELLFQNQAGTWTQIATNDGGGSGPTLQVNGVNLSDQSVLNFLDTASVTWSNPADGDVEATTPTNIIQNAAPGCRVNNSASLTIPNNTATTLTFDTDLYDPYGMHSTSSNTDRITVATTGMYLVNLCTCWAQNSTGGRYILIDVNATTAIAEASQITDSGDKVRQTVTTLWHATAGDYFRARAVQSSGGDLDILNDANRKPSFSAQLVSI